MYKRIFQLIKIARKLSSSGAVATVDEIHKIPTSVKIFFEVISIGAKKNINTERRVKKQSLVNRIRKSKYRSAIKLMEAHLKAGEKDKAKKYFSKFQSVLMQVAKSGVINKNTVSRKISRISKKIFSK